MKILLVAATRFEIEPVLSKFAHPVHTDHLILPNLTVEILVTGVGMVATAYSLGKHLALNQYDLAINAGVAGSFSFDIDLGEVVLITEDIFAEQGAEDGEEFRSLNELGFGEITQYPVSPLEMAKEANMNLNFLDQIRKVNAITVNKVHGHELSISKTLSRFKAEVESMEGAAFFYACNQSKTPCIQVRTISNYVERRDKEKWKLSLAINNLNEFLVNLLAS